MVRVKQQEEKITVRTKFHGCPPDGCEPLLKMSASGDWLCHLMLLKWLMANDAGSSSLQCFNTCLFDTQLTLATFQRSWRGKCHDPNAFCFEKWRLILQSEYLTSQKQHLHPVPLQGVVSCQFDAWEIIWHATSYVHSLAAWRHGEHGLDVTVGLDDPGLRGVFSLPARNHWRELHWRVCEGTQQGAVLCQPSCKQYAVHGRHGTSIFHCLFHFHKQMMHAVLKLGIKNDVTAEWVQHCRNTMALLCNYQRFKKKKKSSLMFILSAFKC